ncbi:MAG: TRAP transporter permease [Deinococcota bacterium]
MAKKKRRHVPKKPSTNNVQASPQSDQEATSSPDEAALEPSQTDTINAEVSNSASTEAGLHLANATSVDDVTADAAAAAEAQRMVEESETGGRQLRGVLHWIVFGLAIAWSLFQLSIASWLTLDSVQSRAIHLAFAITLTFLVFPSRKSKSHDAHWRDYVYVGFASFFVVATLVFIIRTYPTLVSGTAGNLANGVTSFAEIFVQRATLPAWLTAFLGLIAHILLVAFTLFVIWFANLLFNNIKRGEISGNVPLYDLVFAVIAGIVVLYLFTDYTGLQNRFGIPIEREVWFGVIFMVLLLEATRRSLGPALAIIGLVFLTYALIGPQGLLSFLRLPGLIAHRGYDVNRIISQMYVTTEGVFGIALGVSTQFVFLFVLFGSMLDKAGAGKYFIDVANSNLGTLRGGPAKAAVVASGLTGMVSGSSLANVVTTGTFTIPLMKRSGYPAHKAGATEVAVSTNGQLMPPVMGAAAFIMAEFVGIKYFDVVRAAFVPAIVSYIALFYVVHLEALKLGLRGLSRSELPPRFSTFIRGVHFLVPLLLLIYGLVIARWSPGRSVMFTIALLALVMFFQEPIKALYLKKPLGPAFWAGFKSIYEGLEAGARNMVGIAVAVATAGIVVGTVNLTGLGLRLTEIIVTLARGASFLIISAFTPLVTLFQGNPEVFSSTTQFAAVLVITAIASLILGLGLPTTANYIVMATLTAPIIFNVAGDFGFVVPLIAAHLFVFFFGILADDTPPVGLAAYAAAAIARSDPIKTGIQGFTYDMRTAILPFMFVFNTRLLLIGVTNAFVGIYIFVTALVGMFAFAAGTQGFALKPLNWPQRIGLILTAFLLIQPGLVSDTLGFLIVFGVYGWQYYQMRQQSLPAPA